MLSTYLLSSISVPPSRTSTRNSPRMIPACLSKLCTLVRRQNGRYCRTIVLKNTLRTMIIIPTARWNSAVTSWTMHNLKWMSTCPVSSLSSSRRDTSRRRSVLQQRHNHFSAESSTGAPPTSSITSTWSMSPISAALVSWKASQLVSILANSWILRLAHSLVNICCWPDSSRKAWSMIVLKLGRSPTQWSLTRYTLTICAECGDSLHQV